jgi:hypothetical protein
VTLISFCVKKKLFFQVTIGGRKFPFLFWNPLFRIRPGIVVFSPAVYGTGGSLHSSPRFLKAKLEYENCATLGRSVADPDPGSGIRCLFDPWIRDPGWVESQHPDPGSGMNNPDHIF